MYEDRWLLGPVVAAETVAARSLEATIKASAAVQIQAWARRLLARLLRARLQRERDCNAAALRLQCWWRGLLSLRELEGRIDDRSRRAVALAGQALWRGKMGRTEAANLRGAILRFSFFFVQLTLSRMRREQRRGWRSCVLLRPPPAWMLWMRCSRRLGNASRTGNSGT